MGFGDSLKIGMVLIAVALLESTPGLAARKPLLSETGLYTDIAQKLVSSDARSFTPQYVLWTDGALKDRYFQLPAGTQINVEDPDRWVFPNGTKLWKEFRFRVPDGSGEKRVETRLLEKLADGSWEFSAYVWNADDTEATLAPLTGIKNHYPIADGVMHDIPSVVSCRRCHNRGGDAVLGMDVLQLSWDRDPLSPHGGAESATTLLTLLNENKLLGAAPDLGVHAPRIQASSPEARAALGYLHGNCGGCHNPDGDAKFTELFLRHAHAAANQEQEPAFQTTVGIPTTGFVIPGQDVSLRIAPGSAADSALFFRLTGTGFNRMPPMGTKLIDEKAAGLIKTWIEGLAGTHNNGG